MGGEIEPQAGTGAELDAGIAPPQLEDAGAQSDASYMPSEIIVPSDPFTPYHLQAFTGGKSIAIRWHGSSGVAVERYDVYRDGISIGSRMVGTIDTNFPERDQCGYIDQTVTPGTTYTYDVRAIDESGRMSEPSPSIMVTHPLNATPEPTITLDASAAPDLSSWLENTVRPFLLIWYPKIVERLAGSSGLAPTSFSVELMTPEDSHYAAIGTAYVHGTSIFLHPDTGRNSPTNTVIVGHEAVHVAQYSAAQNVENTPSYMLEASAHWGAIHMLRGFEAFHFRGDSFRDGYFPGALLLSWIEEQYDPDFVRVATSALYAGTFNDNLFVEHTGKTNDELWAELFENPVPLQSAIRFRQIQGMCIEARNDGLVLATCDRWSGQSWTMGGSQDLIATSVLTATGYGCLAEGLTGPTVKVPCGEEPSRGWEVLPDGSLRNQQSGNCLQASGIIDGSPLQVAACNGTSMQIFDLPTR